MSVFRRSLLLRSLLQEDDYIRKGLVFHLDGINKGKNEGKWTDLIGGIEFENHNAVPLYDGWMFNNKTSLQSYLDSHAINYPWDNSTIEIAFVTYEGINNNVICFVSGVADSVAFGFIKTSGSKVTDVFSGKHCKNSTSGLTFNLNPRVNKPDCLSSAKDIVLYNGEQISKSNTSNCWSIPNLANSIIGGRYNGSYFNGKIYSIRIYNRLLTEEEMHHNQEVDYKRFDFANFGKIVYIESTSDKIDIKINNRVDTYNILPNVLQKIVIKESITSFREIIINSNATKLDLSNFDTSAINNFYQAFYYNYILKDIILGAAKPVNIGLTFSHCVNLKSIDISKWDLSDVTSTDRTFLYNRSLTDLKFGKNLKKSIDLSYASLTHESALSVINGLAEVNTPQNLIFKDSTYLSLSEEEIALATNKGWNVVMPSSVIGKVVRLLTTKDSITLTINGSNKIFTVTPNKYNRIFISDSVVALATMCRSNNNLLSLDLSNLDMTKITDINHFVNNCTNLESVILSEAANITWLYNAFGNCKNLKSVDMSKIDLGKVTQSSAFSYIFYGCTSLKDLKFGYNLKFSINFKSCPLSYESALSVINGLAEITTTQTITFSGITSTYLNTKDVALATSKGWTIVDADNGNIWGGIGTKPGTGDEWD